LRIAVGLTQTALAKLVWTERNPDDPHAETLGENTASDATVFAVSDSTDEDTDNPLYADDRNSTRSGGGEA